MPETFESEAQGLLSFLRGTFHALIDGHALEADNSTSIQISDRGFPRAKPRYSEVKLQEDILSHRKNITKDFKVEIREREIKTFI